ncbi:MAG: ATP-binding cassette domain-containing protein, partial [Planctomycetes bacterium]|nr:ATP-binding cassette domain-containing protein [Planctomycetota bacterium]
METSLERLGLSVAKISGKKNIQLSGGECQRVALALSLIGTPKLLLADEPLTAMDPRMRQPAIKLLREKVDQGMMLVLASHNLPEMEALVDRLLVIYEGEVIEDIPNDRTDQGDTGYRHPHTQDLSASPGAAALPGRAGHHDGAETCGCPYRAECRLPLDRPTLD